MLVPHEQVLQLSPGQDARYPGAHGASLAPSPMVCPVCPTHMIIPSARMRMLQTRQALLPTGVSSHKRCDGGAGRKDKSVRGTKICLL